MKRNAFVCHLDSSRRGNELVEFLVELFHEKGYVEGSPLWGDGIDVFGEDGLVLGIVLPLNFLSFCLCLR